MISKLTFSVAADFSQFPAGRTKEDGPHSGERLRDLLLELLPAVDIIVVELNGTMGYGSSFLEAAFGGLGGERFEFVADDKSLITEIRGYLPSREELMADRDALYSTLLPLAVNLACLRTEGRFDPAKGKTAECGECDTCRARALAMPIVKWIRKGWDRDRKHLVELRLRAANTSA